MRLPTLPTSRSQGKQPAGGHSRSQAKRKRSPEMLSGCSVAPQRCPRWSGGSPRGARRAFVPRSSWKTVETARMSAYGTGAVVLGGSDGSRRVVVPGKGQAERLRNGRMADDGLAYKEILVIRSYEAGVNKTATIGAVANMLQELACNHIQSLGFSTDGFGTTEIMRKLDLIWVISRMHIEMHKYPAWGETIEIETWFQEEGKRGTRRDWLLKNLTTGEIIGRATSKWVMMNQVTRRFQLVTDEMREEYVEFSQRPTRLAFPEEGSASKKISKLDYPAQYSRLGLLPRRSDLDMNQHVNNVTYIGWAIESMPQDIINAHELQAITLDYKRECQLNAMVDSLTSMELLEKDHGTRNDSTTEKMQNQKPLQFLHFLRLSDTNLEINRCRTVWRKLPDSLGHPSF